MGHPPGAVTLPSPAFAGLAPAVARITATWGTTPARLVELLQSSGDANPGEPDRPEQLAAIAWVLDPPGRRVLLVHHRAYGWSCPGGHVERGESAAGAAARELAEETGLVAEPVSLDPVTLTLADVASDDGPPHRHWILGYRFVADPDTALVVERDPVAWHDVATPPTPAVDDLVPLLHAVASLRSATVRDRKHLDTGP